MNPAAAIDHQYTVAAYVITLGLHLGYVAWLLIKWRGQK
jgi:hypothetical protein